MSECECLKGCPFFNDKMKDTEGIGVIFKEQYCLGDNSDCARYLVFKKLGKSAVPKNLYPNMLERAKNILAGQ